MMIPIAIVRYDRDADCVLRASDPSWDRLTARLRAQPAGTDPAPVRFRDYPAPGRPDLDHELLRLLDARPRGRQTIRLTPEQAARVLAVAGRPA